MYSPETIATTANTSTDVASVNLVFRLRRMLPPRLVFFEFVVKRFEADAEQLGGARLVLACRGERLQNQLALRIFHRRAHRKADAAQSARGQRGSVTKIGREVRSSDHAAIGRNRRPLEDVAQLADVAGPRIRPKELHDIG